MTNNGPFSERTTSGNNRILAVAYGNGRFVAVGLGGRMAYANW